MSIDINHSEPFVQATKHASAPANAPAGKVRLYFDSSGILHVKDESGVDTALSGGGNGCTCVVDFGTGNDVASVVVTGQAWVVAATSIIVCQAVGEDARLEGIICNAHTLVDGVGFTVTAQAAYIAVGEFTVNCIGV